MPRFNKKPQRKPTLKQIASEYAGRERHCGKCEMSDYGKKLCPVVEVCWAAYVRGFLKGASHAKRNQIF